MTFAYQKLNQFSSERLGITPMFHNDSPKFDLNATREEACRVLDVAQLTKQAEEILLKMDALYSSFQQLSVNYDWWCRDIRGSLSMVCGRWCFIHAITLTLRNTVQRGS